jgi:hypothetical protein
VILGLVAFSDRYRSAASTIIPVQSIEEAPMDPDEWPNCPG